MTRTDSVIDPGNSEWPREQVARIIRGRIAAGEYSARLPSHEQLAEGLGVAPKTVQKALDILKAEGLIYAVRGRGTFLTER